MTSRTRKPRAVSLKQAFETEHARRELERREREEAERRQQEQDLARAGQLHALVAADADFLADRGLTLDRRRYTVSLDHPDFRIAAYFEAGKVSVTSADKRFTVGGTAAPRRQQTVEGVEDALRAMAQFLVDETR